MSTVVRYLKTLRRIPDDVVLDMATREFVMHESWSCLCGWAVRADLLRACGSEGDPLRPSKFAAQERFGGSLEEWTGIFRGVCYPDTQESIEEAFARRVDEAVRGAT